jgi:hypothetical protein
MRRSYELSLRLRRELSSAETFTVPLPRCLDVQRERGWLAVEVPGKLRLDEVDRKRIVPVDLRRLPSELLRSAVSPILRAYRYHGSTHALRLSARVLPEHQPASESIDRLRAFSVLSPAGRALTELRLTLRNRLRRSLPLELARGVRVRSVLLDGRPVKPGRDAKRRLVLPLRRSAAGFADALTVSVIIEQDIGSLRQIGHKGLALPAIALPVASAKWTLYLPKHNRYTELSRGLFGQTAIGRGRWYQGATRGATRGPAPQDQTTLSLNDPAGASAGAMPVRIQLPKSGRRYDLQRYWIPAHESIRTSFWFMHQRYAYPLVAALLVLFGFMVFLVRTAASRKRRWALLAIALAVAIPLYLLAGCKALQDGLGHGSRVLFQHPASPKSRRGSFGVLRKHRHRCRLAARDVL